MSVNFCTCMRFRLHLEISLVSISWLARPDKGASKHRANFRAPWQAALSPCQGLNCGRNDDDLDLATPLILPFSSWAFHALSLHRPNDPVIPLLGIHPKELKAGTQTDACTPVFTAATWLLWLLKVAKYPSTDEWINTMSIYVKANIIQPKRRMKFWYILYHRWTLKILWQVK